MGVSVENADYVDASTTCGHGRAREILSLEPLLGPLKKLKLKNRLGSDRRRQSARADPVGHRHPRPVREGRRRVLLQAVGRQEQEEGRPRLEGKTYDAMPDTAPTVPSRACRELPDAPGCRG
jgi:protein gp37